ncbi:Hypothetical protein NocV09_00101810 [Nannochloropsis oceanica]
MPLATPCCSSSLMPLPQQQLPFHNPPSPYSSSSPAHFFSPRHRRATSSPLAFGLAPSLPCNGHSATLHLRNRHFHGRTCGAITCGLTVLRDRTLRRLLPSQFTGDQWKYYWGITESDKFGKIYEAASSTFFGLWISWFLTFLIGLPAATILGTVFLFYWILAPGLAAYRRNLSFRGGYFARHPRDEGVFGALFSGKVVRVGRITQAEEYNRPEAMVMCVEDEEGRKLRVYAPVLPSYKRVRPGMRCEGLVLSETPEFEELLGVSDLFVPAAGAWVGEYPYIDKVPFKAFLGNKLKKEEENRKRRRKEGLGLKLGMGEEGEEEEEEEAMSMDFLEEEDELEGLDKIFEGGSDGYSRGDEDMFASIWEGSMKRGGRVRRGWEEEEEEEGLLRVKEDEDEERRRRGRRRRLIN